MSWNIKPGQATLRPAYRKKQSSSFLEQALRPTLNTTPQSSLNYPGSNQDACMFLSNSNPVSQPQVNIRNYKTQQMPLSNMHSEAVMTSQTSVERITYTNVKGHKQLDHNFQMSPGLPQNVWLNSSSRNSMLSHTGTAVTHQTSFGTSTPSLHALPNQYVTSDTYSVQLQMVPSNSVRVPVTYQGIPRLNPSLLPQGDWAQQHAASGLTYPEHRPLPQQYTYSSRSCLQDPAHQKQNSVSSTSLQVKNSHPPNSALTYEPKPIAPAPSYPYAATQANKRPPPPYECSFPRQPLQSPQPVVKHSTMDMPQSQETHSPELRKDFGRGFQQQWQNFNENVSTLGNFCDLEVRANVSQPYGEPVGSSVPGAQSLTQNNQEKRMDSCSLPSTQVLDTSATKEKLVRDIKTLVEIKKKFSELARKIKINKDLLMAAGCIKTTNPPYSDSAQHSELTLKKTAKSQSAPQVTQVTAEMVQDKPPTVMESAEQNNRAHHTSNSNTSCKKFNRVFLNPLCMEKLLVPGHFQDLQGLISLKTATVPVTPETSSNSQFSPGNSVNTEQNAPKNFEATFLPHSTLCPSFEESVEKYRSKHPLILSLLEAGNNTTQQKLVNDDYKILQDTNLHSTEITPNTQVTGNQLNLKTMETPGPCSVNAKISDNLSLEHKSSATGMSSQSEGQCPMELLATCLSLWKKQPSEPTEEKQHCDSRAQRTATGMSKAVEICDKSPMPVAGNTETKMVNSLQETTLSTAVQNYESSSVTVTKGTELQIAVVSPLILSDVKTLPVKEMAPGALPEAVYPVIKEGSVCSLQNKLAEDRQDTATLNVNDQVASTIPSSKIFPVIQNEKQMESANVTSEDIPNPDQWKYIKAEPDSHYQVTSALPSLGSRGWDVLQIDSICSLVEGDISYNSQIAKIFSMPPLQKVEPQKPLPSHQVVNGRQQKEQLDDIIEKKDFGFQKGNFEQGTGVSHEITDESKSPHPPESSSLKHVETNSGILEQGSLGHITSEDTGGHACPSAIPQQGGHPQETDMPCDNTAQDPVGSGILDESTSVSYLHDQLSELLKEFPFGIEARNTCEDSVPQVKKDEVSKDQACEKIACDSKDSADQIQITLLSSEQMRELFPEQDDQPHEAKKVTESQKEVPAPKEGSQTVPQAHSGDGDNSDCVIVDLEKDDVRCCALGWLSGVYKGIPGCQCHSIKDETSAREKEKTWCSLETKDGKPGDRTSDQAIPVEANDPPDNNQRISLSFPDRKNSLSEIEQGKTIKQKSKTKHNDSVRTEQELSGQLKSDRKKDSSKRHKRSGKLQFHEITFHSSNKVTKPSQEKLQKKHMTPNSHLVQAKGVGLTNKNKEPHRKTTGSLAQQVSPEDRTLKVKAGGSSQKREKRKLDEDSVLDSVIKKKKYEHEQSKNVTDGTVKCHPLPISSERASVKEKTVSKVKTSSSTESSSKMSRLVTAECIQRQKHKEAMGVKVSKKKYVKSRSRDYQIMRSSKLALRVGSCGKSSMRHSSSGGGQTSKEVSNVCTSLSKNLKIHHSEESKTHISKSIKGAVGGKPSDKMWKDKTKVDKSASCVNSEGALGQMSSHAKDQRKRYLNRVAFKCTERESICLTKLDSSPRKLGRDKERPESKPKSFLPGKETSDSRSMLEFKLCPDSMMKNASSAEDQKDLKPCPRKEQAPLQVSGIKSTKEDWLKCVTEEKRMPEATEDLDNNILTNSRLSKRSFSADGFDTGQNPVKDSKAMFQTYKKMYMEKRSRSLGSSPLK
ncbi:retroelement silencing factor 1 [Talpa occidentalis]|uniref:retroelement silencing factor 1 n=1 Tax=Talpa occidentalis TaxID=50954 RepID=UPI0023F797EC|nr:retroelement silencing factor 1 [Talpa occidentalis]XP_037369962.2 retroelement silencing factor 1 [Talpa occidentalis]XP_037369963.2 retroelement silencing factor 1 [Talpa occidentalis]XP_037369964.2 retroelement silencing factor 1 [Talpa occidentalis]XP_054552246.1 retroelement silencing factor 1 [Talpa occidentalis]XP_054552247.1 retroelement silencing factor 1 [Talpa occidentalis]